MGELLNRPCPICQTTQQDVFLVKGDLQLRRCARCAMIYADPVPAEIGNGDFYNRLGNEYLTPEKLESDYAEVRFERELRLFRTYCKAGSVLDVGCSSGAFLYQLRKRYGNDYEVCGTDVSGAPLDYAAKNGVPVIRQDFLTHQFKNPFDAITFWAVMEHLFEPQSFLRKAASILKPGGLCFVLVPNMRSLAVRLLGVKYRYIYSEHLNYFNPEVLKKFMAAEFTVLGLQSTHFNPIVIWKDFRGGAREISRAERSQLLKRTTAYKQSPWLTPIKYCYRATEKFLSGMMMADNLAIVGRKE